MWITWLVMLRQTAETSIGTSIVRKKTRQTPEISNSTSIVRKKDTQGIPPLKRKNGKGVAQSDLERAEEFNGQFTVVFNKNEHPPVPLLDRSALFMGDIVVFKDGVIKLLKGLNPSKALGPDELHFRVPKELVTELDPVLAHLFQQSIDTGGIPKNGLLQISGLFSWRVTSHLRAIIARFPWRVYLASYSNTEYVQKSWLILMDINSCQIDKCIHEKT